MQDTVLSPREAGKGGLLWAHSAALKVGHPIFLPHKTIIHCQDVPHYTCVTRVVLWAVFAKKEQVKHV